MGATGLLFDEDTCATNFMIRDRRMQLLVEKNKEPITPLIHKIQSLFKEKLCSSILVVGGCSAYFDVADCVIAMDEYKVKDVTQRAKQIAMELPDPSMVEMDSLVYGHVAHRRPLFTGGGGPLSKRPHSLENMSEIQQPYQQTDSFSNSSKRPAKSSANRSNLVVFEGTEIDLNGLEQLISVHQSKCIIDCIDWIRRKCQQQQQLTICQAIELLETEWVKRGCLDGVSPFPEPSGDYARPRTLDIAAALNRLPGFKAVQ